MSPVWAGYKLLLFWELATAVFNEKKPAIFFWFVLSILLLARKFTRNTKEK